MIWIFFDSYRISFLDEIAEKKKVIAQKSDFD